MILAEGGGALSDQEASALRVNATGPVTHLDLVPTIANLLDFRATAEGLGHRFVVGESLFLTKFDYSRVVIGYIGPPFIRPIKTIYFATWRTIIFFYIPSRKILDITMDEKNALVITKRTDSWRFIRPDRVRYWKNRISAFPALTKYLELVLELFEI